MTGDGYLYAWLIYLACSVGLLLCFWYITRRFYFWLKQPLRALLVVFLLVPWQADSGVSGLAPAWLTMLFDGLLKQDVAIGRAGLPLLLALLVASILVCISLYFHYRKTDA